MPARLFEAAGSDLIPKRRAGRHGIPRAQWMAFSGIGNGSLAREKRGGCAPCGDRKARRSVADTRRSRRRGRTADVALERGARAARTQAPLIRRLNGQLVKASRSPSHRANASRDESHEKLPEEFERGIAKEGAIREDREEAAPSGWARRKDFTAFRVRATWDRRSRLTARPSRRGHRCRAFCRVEPVRHRRR